MQSICDIQRRPIKQGLMHVLVRSPELPGTGFGHIAHHLVAEKNYRCTFVSQTAARKRRRHRENSICNQRRRDRAKSFSARARLRTPSWHTDAVYAAALMRRSGHQAGSDRRPFRFWLDAFPSRSLRRSPDHQSLRILLSPALPDDDMDFRRDLNWKLPENNYHPQLAAAMR